MAKADIKTVEAIYQAELERLRPHWELVRAWRDLVLPGALLRTLRFYAEGATRQQVTPGAWQSWVDWDMRRDAVHEGARRLRAREKNQARSAPRQPLVHSV